MRSPSVWFAVLISVWLALWGLIVFDYWKVSQQEANTNRSWSLIARPIGPEDHTQGSLDAPIQMIVYSDFECEYCRDLLEIDVPKLKQKFPNKLVVAYRHRILESDPSSRIEEEASECVAQAGDNDVFWRFAHSLFHVPSGTDKKDPRVLSGIAVQSGADAAKYKACMSAGDGKAAVDRDNLEAAIAGMTRDPSILLKSAHRALIVQGEHYSQLETGIQYLIQAESQIKSR